jgi:hypothetical protein
MKRFVTKSTTLLDASGFTLVEAIVSGVLSLLVLLAAVAVFMMNSKQVSGGFVSSVAKLQYQTVIDQIGLKVRRSSVISSTNQNILDAGGAAILCDQIFLFDLTGNCGGYQRAGTALQQWNGTQFVNFTVGSRNVQVKDVGATNTFTIAPDRKSVQVNLTVICVDGKSKDTMYSNKETFKCRN